MSARLLIRLAICSLPAPQTMVGTLIQCVIARREIFDVAVIAGEYNGSLTKSIRISTPLIRRRDSGARSCRRHILCVSDLVGDEVFVEREPILADDVRQHGGSLFRSSRHYVLAALDQRSISEVMEDGPASLYRPLGETVTRLLPPLQSLPRPNADARRKTFCV